MNKMKTMTINQDKSFNKTITEEDMKPSDELQKYLQSREVRKKMFRQLWNEITKLSKENKENENN